MISISPHTRMQRNAPENDDSRSLFFGLLWASVVGRSTILHCRRGGTKWWLMKSSLILNFQHDAPSLTTEFVALRTCYLICGRCSSKGWGPRTMQILIGRHLIVLSLWQVPRGSCSIRAGISKSNSWQFNFADTQMIKFVYRAYQTPLLLKLYFRLPMGTAYTKTTSLKLNLTTCMADVIHEPANRAPRIIKLCAIPLLMNVGGWFQRYNLEGCYSHGYLHTSRFPSRQRRHWGDLVSLSSLQRLTVGSWRDLAISIRTTSRTCIGFGHHLQWVIWPIRQPLVI